MDLGESLVDTAVRETREETGITCEVTGLVGIYTDPRHVILYTSDGEARQEFSVVFTARPISGTPTTEQRDPRGRVGRPRRRSTDAADGPLDAAADRALPVRPARAPPWLTGTDAVRRLGVRAGGRLVGARHHRRVRRRVRPVPPRAPPRGGPRRGRAPLPGGQGQRVGRGATHRRPAAKSVLFFVHNASDMPIYEVSLPTPDDGDDEAEFIGLVPPGQTIQRPAPREWLATYYAPEPVEIEFLDSSGRRGPATSRDSSPCRTDGR